MTEIYGGLVLCNRDIILAAAKNVIILNEELETKVIPGFSQIQDIALAADGTLYVSDYRASKVYLFLFY